MLNYPTLFFCDVVTGSVYAAAMVILAVQKPDLKAHRWFTAAVLFGLVRNALMGTLGMVPLPLAILVPSLCNISSFFCMYMGFRLSIIRRPLKSLRWPIILLAEMALFAILFLSGVKRTFVLSIGPIFVLCCISLWTLARNKEAELRPASIAGMIAVIAHLLVIGLRTPLILLRYDVSTNYAMRPARTDPLWLGSMAAMMFVSACFFLVYLWFFELALNRELRMQVRTDARTGTLNVRALEDEAEREVLRAARRGLALSVLALDLDHFKSLNDTYGHAAGDEVLRRVAIIMREEVRAGDVVARTGGEEFTILLPETDTEAAYAIAERLRQQIGALLISIEDKELQVTASIGVTSYLGSNDAWPLLQRRADYALYEAKHKGRNCISVSLRQEWTPSGAAQRVS